MKRVAVLAARRWSAGQAMAVPCMSADVLLWRGQVLLALATASAGQISLRCWRPRPAASGAAGTLSAAGTGPTGPGSGACRCGLVTPAAGVLASLLPVPRA